MADVESRALAEFDQDLADDSFEGIENADALHCHRFKDGFTFDQEQPPEFLRSHDIGQVPFVELEHIGDLAQIETVLFKVIAKIGNGLEVRVEPFFL